MGVCSLGLFACSKTATVSGTYYYYENGKYDGAMYIKFGATKWTDDEERNGDYKINGKNIVLYMGLESENNVFLSGTVKGDEVKLNVSGEQYVYKKNADLDILPEKSLVFEPNADKTAYTVTGIGELSGEIVVPDTYKKKPVVEIADNVFNKNDNITSVTIGNNVKSIGDYAFSWCSNLASVTIGNNVKSIGEDAFHGCSSLTRITIPDSVTSIGGYAFYNCRNLTSITIPESVTSIGWSAFYNCSSLTGITIGNGVTGIGPYAFENCSSLMGITIGSGVTGIGPYAFENCSSLMGITIGSGV
ncbi:MAG: leucine-rich repeat domain-containing protein, partial [Clostridiales bacterium]|nr:leucine-rich repeat domain-containing protein [Clostridiales bacterium]